jgi:hypothetical protein
MPYDIGKFPETHAMFMRNPDKIREGGIWSISLGTALLLLPRESPKGFERSFRFEISRFIYPAKGHN